MNYKLLIAKRIIASKSYKSSVSSPIIKIASIAIAIGIIIMLIAVATGIGLQQKIREKIAGFNGHIIIRNFDNNQSQITLKPVDKNQEFYPEFKSVSGIKNVQVYASKAGIIRTATDFEGIILKGVGRKYNWQFFKEYLVEGRIPKLNTKKASTEVLISEEIAKRMKLKLNQPFNVLFLKENTSKPPWIRVFIPVGIYRTGFNDFDSSYVIGDIRHIQKMNKWSENEVGGFEVLLNNFDTIKSKTKEIYKTIDSQLDATNIVDKYPAIFEWIGLFDNNIYLILFIMVLVSGINMITALLVLILERTQMIGILKALGANNMAIRKVFLYNAVYIIAKGLFWGNLIGLSLLFIQKYFGIISLNPKSYYVNSVPIYLNLNYIVLLNLGTLFLCLTMLLIPSLIIAKINPAKSIKFE
ncbi:MAG: ABC transporter permease [Lutibacter sp.]